MSVGRVLRGIRDRIPPGYVLGRVKPGNGPVELIKVVGLGQPPGQGGNSNLTANGITALTGDVTAEGPGEVPATLASTGVTPGSYTSTNLTVDAKGRLTAASNGGAGGTVTTTGSPANGNLTKFSGATTITNGDLSGDVTTAGTLVATIANDAVSNAKLANMAAWTLKARNNAASGDPQDAALADFTEEAAPEAGDFIVGFLGSGELRKFDVGNIASVGSWVPSVDGSEPPNFITDGAGNLIFVFYTP